MTDREMLELAAKAAGMRIHTKNQAERDEMGFGDKGLWIVGGSSGWNPLTDDGDALRLSVNLSLGIDYSNFGSSVYVGLNDSSPSMEVVIENKCKLSATRRAIVRAAAEIGKRMT